MTINYTVHQTVHKLITKQGYTTVLSQHNLLQELCYLLTLHQYSMENFGACFYTTIVNRRQHYGNIAKD